MKSGLICVSLSVFRADKKKHLLLFKMAPDVLKYINGAVLQELINCAGKVPAVCTNWIGCRIFLSLHIFNALFFPFASGVYICI